MCCLMYIVCSVKQDAMVLGRCLCGAQSSQVHQPQMSHWPGPSHPAVAAFSAKPAAGKVSSPVRTCLERGQYGPRGLRVLEPGLGCPGHKHFHQFPMSSESHQVMGAKGIGIGSLGLGFHCCKVGGLGHVQQLGRSGALTSRWRPGVLALRHLGAPAQNMYVVAHCQKGRYATRVLSHTTHTGE